MRSTSSHAAHASTASLVALLLFACQTTPADTGTTTTASTTTDSSGSSGTNTGSQTTTSSTESSGGEMLQPGEDAQVQIFADEHVYFGDENRRQIDVEVALPASGEYDEITLDFALNCPNGLCDHWDRYGTIGVVRWPGAEDEGYVEIARFITAYRLPAAWTLDMTDLRPLLKGDTTIRVFIDTWVGPGSDQGEGWLVDASLNFHGGIPSPRAIEVYPLWYQSFSYGDPMNPVNSQVLSQSFTPPADATSFQLRSHITGHGFGNVDNCAEFCPRVHGYQLNGEGGYAKTIWRDDCPETAVPDQFGTWKFPRAGWCPGADVRPWLIDATETVNPGMENTVVYAVDDYENSCRPDADPCVGCVGGASCDDGHSLPYYYLSALMIAYR
ncbi:MAG TPA: hypothetical protein ENJ18_07400 [Nannocystis exedens]|nr:hypothetical protein [Nannocystis exedens]